MEGFLSELVATHDTRALRPTETHVLQNKILCMIILPRILLFVDYIFDIDTLGVKPTVCDG